MTKSERPAPWGERMIKVDVKLRFWTDHVADAAGSVLPGFCWEHGIATVEVQPNRAHGIRGAVVQTAKFHEIADLQRILVSALKRADVKMMFSNRYRARGSSSRRS